MRSTLSDRLAAAIRNVPDFPKPGILFRDITTLLLSPPLVAEALDALWAPFAGEVDVIAGIESRGFLFGMPLADRHALPFVPLRKPGKLPAAVHRESYQLEYGADAIEVHQDALRPGQRVLIVDDLLATGGTAAAAAALIDRAGATVVGLAFLVELDFLAGREKLAPWRIHSLVHYAGEE